MAMSGWITAQWPAPQGVHALTTTRDGDGVSVAPFDRFNMGNCASPTGDDPQAVQTNRERLQQQAKLPSAPFWLKQVHGVEVVELKSAEQLNDLPAADAAFTRKPNLVISIQTADCLPVLLTDRRGTVVAGAHAGWRSLAAGVIERTVEAMQVPASELLVWLGPAAGPQRYEIGVDVFDAFVSQDWKAASAFKCSRDDHWHVDLYTLAKQRLEALGVPAAQIFGGDLCTITDANRFYSHRRDQRTGRMASLIWRTG